MRKTPPKFFVAVPVKPYVKRFIDINYGTPADFNNHPEVHGFFQKLLRKPSTRFDNNYPSSICTYTEEIEVIISEDDFYRYGFELTKTDIVSFGKLFEERVKMLMRSMVGIYHGIGLPLNVSINKFQDRFNFDEDTWSYQTIKKDFYRNGTLEKIDFNNEIFTKIEKILLVNLYSLGTISHKAKKAYENN